MLGSIWSGVASAADPTTTTPAPPTAAAAATGPTSAQCQTLTTQLAQATAVLEAAGGVDPTGTLKGAVTTLTGQVATACAAITGGTTTTTSTAPGSGSLTALAAGTADRDCKDFISQAQAQAYFTSIGGSAARNADRLDANRNGVACEDYPYATGAAATTYPAGTFGQVATVPSGGIETGDGSTAP
jgi:hypothetical protein